MSDWRPIETAPKDGTAIQAKIPGHGSDNIIAWVGGYYDGSEQYGGVWTMVEDQEPPDCWTDGVCWNVNEDGVPSVKPTHWMPLPEPPKEGRMSDAMTVVRLQAAAEMASAASLPTSLKLCSDGIEVETWSRGRRISKTVTWADVKYAYANPVVAAINSNIQELDSCTTTGGTDE